MTKKTISEAVGSIADRHIKEADEPVRKTTKPLFTRLGAAAACLVLMLLALTLPVIIKSPSDSLTPVSFLTITAHAAENVSNILGINQTVLSSIGEQSNIFGNDMPLFNITIAPSDTDTNGKYDIFSKYELEISYNGKIVTGKDEHVMVGYVIYAEGHEGTAKYNIAGWFTEPTDLFVCVKEISSGEVVESQKINVRYSEEANAYELTLTEVYGIAFFDIDGDGVTERCCLSPGQTSGVFTFVFTAFEGSAIEYQETYHTEFYYLSFVTTNDGRLKIQGVTQKEPAETHVFDLVLRNGRIYLDDGDTVISPLGQK